MGAHALQHCITLLTQGWGRMIAPALLFCLFAVPVRANGFASIDFCADQYLLALADRADIQAVSYEAVGPQSYYGGRAAGLRAISGQVEEIIALHPTLVLRTYRGGPRMVQILDRAGIASLTPPYVFSLEGNLAVLKSVGEKIGAEARADAITADYQARLAWLKKAPRSPLKAVYMTPSGFTAGEGTYIDDLIHLAGFESIAEQADMEGWVPLPLEKMVQSPPDFVVASFFEDTGLHVSHWSSGRHGVYKRLMGALPTIHVPSRFLSCSGFFAVDAAEYIRTEATRLGLIAGRTDD